LLPAVREQVRTMQREGRTVIDKENREMPAVHHTGFIVAEPGQIYRGHTNSAYGIDGEATQIRSSKRCRAVRSHPHSLFGLPSGFEIRFSNFSRWLLLVLRRSDGEIRWMDVSAYLKCRCAGGKAAGQIVFAGERFNAVSVQKWRKMVLGHT